VKKANGQILTCHELIEKNTRVVKNYGVWLRYESRTGTHNMCAREVAARQFQTPPLSARARRAVSLRDGGLAREPPARGMEAAGRSRNAASVVRGGAQQQAGLFSPPRPSAPLRSACQGAAAAWA